MRRVERAGSWSLDRSRSVAAVLRRDGAGRAGEARVPVVLGRAGRTGEGSGVRGGQPVVLVSCRVTG